MILGGECVDLAVGQEERFALEFGAAELKATKEQSRSFERVRGSFYQVTCRVIFVHEECWVIDFGLMAYQARKPPDHIRIGDILTGQVYLGVDPFFYSEGLCRLQGIPELRYPFKVQAIELETTPMLETIGADGRRVLTRDEARRAYVDVDKTDAVKDDKGSGHYVLECVLRKESGD